MFTTRPPSYRKSRSLKLIVVTIVFRATKPTTARVVIVNNRTTSVEVSERCDVIRIPDVMDHDDK